MDVVLFDIDGTLIHSGGAGRDALDMALLELFGYASSAAIELHGRTDRGIARNIFRHFGIDESEANWRRFRDAYLAALPDRLAARQGCVLPGVMALLDELKMRPKTAFGLLTGNIREGARMKLSHYGMHHPFPFGGFGDRHHERDDVAREAWGAVQQHVGGGVRLDRVWIVGDTPHDITCARAIGARVAAVATGGFSTKELAAYSPDLLLDDLSDPAPLLEAMETVG
jgi:phosphoglycolate phosphatase